MAKLSVAERRKLMEEAQHIKEPEPSLSSDNESNSPESGVRGSASSHSASVPGAFGGLFSGIVHGGLDVLESLGKKTFETLTVKDEVSRTTFEIKDPLRSAWHTTEVRAGCDEVFVAKVGSAWAPCDEVFVANVRSAWAASNEVFMAYVRSAWTGGGTRSSWTV